MATRKSDAGTGQGGSTRGSSASAGGDGKGTTGSSRGRTANRSTAKPAASTAADSGRRAGRRTSEASATGATARARITSSRAKSRASSRPTADRPDLSIAEPTVTATDDVLAASSTERAISPDMPRVAWLRTQLQNLEARRAERLVKVAQLTLIAIVFITFVLQNAQPVNVHFLFFSLNIRLIWVIFGCGLLGGAAGYLVGRPDKSLRALLPEKEKKPTRNGRTRRATGV